MSLRASGGRRGLAIDVALAAAVFMFTVAMLFGRRGENPEVRDVDAVAVALAALTAVPLVWRRRAPLLVFAITTAASAALYGLRYPDGPPLGPTVALYSLGRYAGATRASLTWTVTIVVSLFAVHVTATGLGDDEVPVVPLLFGLVLWGGAWVIGDRIRMRRERAAELEHEAERELRLAVAEERTRIARDLHDSAGHAINVILVQAAAARLLSESDPERSRAALSTIENVARETVAEIDRLVRNLREDGRSDGAAAPVGLAALDTLVQRHLAAGLEVTIRTHGVERPLAPAVDQAAFRIVQEALTNAGRHGGSSATVEIGYGSNEMELTISNPTRPGRSEWVPGHGIVGMRERATLLGGRLDVSRDGRTFRVLAVLPYRRGER